MTNLKYHNKIQVFGLHRSGTNFLEWSLNNNFKGINYKRYTEYDKLIKGNYKGLTRFNDFISLKHTKPTLDYCDYIIATYKPLDEWISSVNRSRHLKNKKECIESYNKWLEDIDKIPSNKIILKTNKEWITNYKDLLEEISTKFDVILNDTIKIPEFRFGTNMDLTNKPFKRKNI